MSDLILVDEQDNIVGVAEKMAAHKMGMLHRAFSVFVFRQLNGFLQVLLQKRQISKYHSGGLWSNSCCGHPSINFVRENKNLEVAAMNRLNEELGIKVTLHTIGNFIYKFEFKNGLIEHELDHILVGIYQQEQINPDPNEVADLKWENVADLENNLLKTPNNFTVWLPMAWQIIKNNLQFINDIFIKEAII